MAPTAIKFSTYERSTALIKARFVKILTAVETIAALPPPLSQVNQRCLSTYAREITKKRADFEGNLYRVLEVLPPEEAPTDQLSDDQDAVNDTFVKIQSIIESLNPVDEPLTPSAHSETGGFLAVAPANIRLPKLELKHFDGNPLQWVSFINLFDSSVHKNATVSNVAKLQYLLSVVSGEPLNLIKSLNITTANYLVAYQLLRERYHNSRRLTTLHLHQLMDLPDVSSGSLRNLRNFVNSFYEHSEALKALECDVSSASNPLLSALLLRKLDSDLRKKLEAYRSTQERAPHSLPEVTDIIQFLNIECNQAEDAGLHLPQSSHKANASPPSYNKGSKPVRFSVENPSKHVTFLATPKGSSPSLSPCFACGESDHKIYSCPLFKCTTPQERYKLVRKNQRCVSCLGAHDIKQCKSQYACSTCQKRHHSLLHFQTGSKADLRSRTSSHDTHSPSTAVTPLPAALAAQSHSHSTHSTVLLGTLLVQLTSPHGTTHVFRALLDSGSMCDFVSERAAQLLGTKRTHSSHQVVGLAQHPTHTKGMVQLDVKTLSGRTLSTHQPFIILDKISVDLPRMQLAPEVFLKARSFTLADPTFHLPGSVDVLLGGSLFPHLLTGERFSLGPNLPHALGSLCGFIIMGQTPCLATPSLASNYSVSLLSTNDAELHSSLQRFWCQEELPSCSKLTAEEELCEQHYSSTHIRDSDGRYVVKLPFKQPHPPLGSSKLAAERRFYSLEQKFKVKPHFYELYRQFMADYLVSGHMQPVPSVNLSQPHYFLPHHGVLKEGSSSTKLRTVFDASAKTSTGNSLNDILLTGRKLQTNICDILINFRIHNVVFSCDIRQMYRQIKLDPGDQQYQLILWRECPSQELITYQLSTVTYGLNSSPYLAIRTLSQLAADEGAAFPEAAKVLTSQSYVDDIITGATDEFSALRLQDQLIALLKKGGFELRKWSSNSPRLLQTVPEEHRETPVFLQDSSQPHFSILGLHWSPTSDTFSYHLDLPTSACTKRQVLSSIARIYDPCGFLAPVTMWCKCFMQILWTQQIGWDEPISEDLATKWHLFISELPAISAINIPRALHFSEAHAIELHGFSDASERGYAAVVYIRCLSPNNTVIVRQIIAKTRVAPLKKVTLPRLELCAAHLLAQLVTYCVTTLGETYPFSSHHLWCDSTVALTWLQTPPFQLKTYVANRVAQAQELIPSNWWHHISGGDNPADCASRGILPSHLQNHPLWYTGPSWLQLPHEEWPQPKFIPVELDPSLELKPQPLSVLTAGTTAEWDLLTKFSSWDKLMRVTAYVLRFINHARCIHTTHAMLTSKELQQATNIIVRLIQRVCFSEDSLAIEQRKLPSPRLRRLTPFMDSNGLIRVGGRLKRATINYDSKHPLLLPKDHPVVRLIVRHYHEKHLHAGPQLTQSLISQKFWILSARQVVRSCIFQCITCFRRKPRNNPPLMGDLPSRRVTPARPFSSTGMDFCGPFTVKVINLRSMRHVKIYICVFICLATKASHLEVVTDLSTDAFIASLTRFTSRRGLPSHLFSDCGTNFVGADTSLQKTLRQSLHCKAAQENIVRFTALRGIEFHFNPPAAPHQGGLWESAVKSVKHHLRRVMGDTVLTLMEFITLTTHIEAMLNSRPLTPISADPCDFAALTPGHFLIGAPLAAVPEPDLTDAPLNRLKHWQLVQVFQQRIWKRWQLEYLHTLQQRSKWSRTPPNLRVGDLVLIHANSPPLTWPLARVTATHPGADGVVRVVDLQTPTGSLTRPAVKVFPLPLN